MIAETIPDFLQAYVDKINQLNIFGDIQANHILLNEYSKGQGIMPHQDGPLFHPIITTLSLGSQTVLRFHKIPETEKERSDPKSKDPVFSLVLEERSLLILKDDLYNNFMHSIQETLDDKMDDELIRNLSCTSFTKNMRVIRTNRYSLTIRHVPNTSKLKLNFGK